ncbi:MAG: ROK family protein [Chloroflexota bacterium]|nr:ROK family protein [Chloroflexota bacterium]
MTAQLYGSIEAGGTKFLCTVGSGPDDIRHQAHFATTSPTQTFSHVIEFFQGHMANHQLSALGIASFGPIDIRKEAPTYGYITKTPKPGWSNIDFVGTMSQALGIPIGFDTDVNAAALGEHRWGSAHGLDTFVYLTIGTGIGGGGMMGGQLMHGLRHPEMGHLILPHDKTRDPFPGCCPFHGDCLEGLACGLAIESRWNTKAELLNPEHPAWVLEADYLALALVNFFYTLSPQRIIIGGGVMHQRQLLHLVRRRFRQLLGDYPNIPEVIDNVDEYIVTPALGDRAGAFGALALAEQTLRYM